MSRKNTGKVLARMFLMAASLVIALGAGELTIGLFAPQSQSWLDVYRPHPALPFYALAPNVTRFVDTGETHWTIYTDANGFRVSDPSERPRESSALVLGDSFTFGYGVDYEQTFVGRMNANEDCVHYYLNAAVPGYGPTQYRMILEHMLDAGFSPELVLVATFLGNDIHDCVWGKDAPVVDGILGNERSLRSFLKRNTHLYRLVSRVYHRVRPPSNGAPAFRMAMYQPHMWREEPLREALQVFEREFRRIGRICRERSIPLYVCIIPTERAVRALAGQIQFDKEGLDYGLPVEKVGAILSKLGIGYVDLTSKLVEIGAQNAYFAYDNHFTPAGNKVTAECIMTALGVGCSSGATRTKWESD